MKKILLITQNFYPEIGSAGNRMKNIYLLLKERGFEIDVLTTEPSYPNRNFYDEKFFWDHSDLNEDNNIYRVKVANKKYSRNIINRLVYYFEIAIRMVFYVLIDRKKYDIVFVTSPPIFVAMVGLFAKYRYKAKLILDVRDLWPESLKGVGVFNYSIIISVFKKVEKLIYIKASNIVVNSKGFIDYISSKSIDFLDKIIYIPNGARNYEITLIKDDEQSNFKVIYVGNIGLAQDDTVIKKLAKELNEKNIELTIMGYGMRRNSLIEYVKEMNLHNVKFLKPTTRKECFKIISDHQIGLVTLMEKDVFKTVLPGKVIDYMTCGLPIIASVSGFSEKLIVNENAGFVTQNNDIDELMAYIEELKINKELYYQMSINGQNYVEKNFLWEKNIDSLVKIITKL